MHTDVIIIGGGISGLVTALHCISSGYRVVIVERNQRLGGRIHTIFSKHWKYEAGAGRISRHHTKTLALLRAFGMSLTEIPHLKQYRDIHTGGAASPQRNPTYSLLRKVMHVAQIMKKETLQQMTFGMLCQQVLGVHQTNKLISSFGYNAEFEHMNAWDGLEMFQRDFAYKNTYYVCNEGLGAWVNRIAEFITSSNMASVFFGCHAHRWKRNAKGAFVVSVRSTDGQAATMSCKAVVCAMPKRDLLESFEWSPYQVSLLEAVQEIPLHRIYGKFPTPWFNEIPVTTTNADIRQFIPVNTQQGLAMMSYSDNQQANMWQAAANSGERHLRSALLEQLHVVFPEITKIPNPSWIHSHYWNAGVHMWKPGYDSAKVSEELLQPFGNDMPFFIVGESYSKHQAWIEGAIETVDEVLPRLFASLERVYYNSNNNGGGGAPTFTIFDWAKRNKYRVRQADLSQLHKLFPQERWVVLTDPSDSQKKLIRVTEWMDLHPGGRHPFESHMYQDVTNLFMNVVSHQDHRHHVKEHVLQMVRKYAVAIVV